MPPPPSSQPVAPRPTVWLHSPFTVEELGRRLRTAVHPDPAITPNMRVTCPFGGRVGASDCELQPRRNSGRVLSARLHLRFRPEPHGACLYGGFQAASFSSAVLLGWFGVLGLWCVAATARGLRNGFDRWQPGSELWIPLVLLALGLMALAVKRKARAWQEQAMLLELEEVVQGELLDRAPSPFSPD